MLNVSDAMTAEAVIAYHEEGGHDYYIDGRNPPGVWGGKLAREFGLEGEVQKEHFERMAYGYHPTTGEDLVLRRTDNRRSANDITISGPKPFSLLYLRLLKTDPEKAEKLLRVFVESCDWIMDKMEPDAGSRVRIDGADFDRKTGNWAYARFLQFESRPDDNTELPVIQIHGHHTVFNLTRDPEEERIKALQIGMVKENADLWMPLFHNELARRVRELGYGIEHDPMTGIVGFGIAGVPRDLVEKFSPRRATIQAEKDRLSKLLKIDDPEEMARAAKKLGITEPWRIELLHQARKDGLEAVLQAEGARLTRKHKQKDLDQGELWRVWENMLSAEDRAALDGAKGRKGWVTTDADTARYLIGHVFYRKHVVSEKKLLAEGLRYGAGSVTLAGLRNELTRQGVVFENGEATTRELGRQEDAITGFAREGRGRLRPVVAEPGEISRLVRTAALGAGIKLSDEQEKVIRGLVGSRDVVNVVDAGQGTGKTTMLETFGNILSRRNVRSTWLGTTHTAVDELKARGRPAMTVARFLASEQEQRKAAGSRIIVDESSMLAHGDTYRLFQYAKENGCRIDLVGDSKQYKSPAGGDTMGLLKRFAGVEPITMTKTMRQEGRLKDAMENIRDGDVLKGHDILTELGMVHEMPLKDLAQKAADLYLQWSADGTVVPVISPTWAQADDIAVRIRVGLRERGDLKGEDKIVRRLVNLNWSPAQLKDAREHGAEGVTLLRYGAYREETLALAVGDLVKTAMGGKTKDGKHTLRAGRKLHITGFTKGDDPILDGSIVVDKDWGGLMQGYVRTGQGWQGITADPRAIVVYGTPSLVATRQDGFYTPVSRVRKEVAVLTDDNAALRRAIQRQESHKSATELLQAAARRRKPTLRQRLVRHLAYVRRLASFTQTHQVRRRALERTPHLQTENVHIR